MPPSVRYTHKCAHFSKPPSEREVDLPKAKTEGACGQNKRCTNFIVARSPSVAYGASSLPEGALAVCRPRCGICTNVGIR